MTGGASAAGTALGTFIGSKISERDTAGPGIKLPQLRAGGLIVDPNFDPGRITVANLGPGFRGGADRAGLISGLAGVSGQAADFFGNLRTTGQLGAGGGAVREALLSDVRAGRQRAIGTIQENLGRRRVLGSSFGQAALAQAEREFAEAEAQTFLQALDTETRLAASEFASLADTFNVQLAELDRQLQVGLAFAGASIPGAIQFQGLQDQLRAQTVAQTAAAGRELTTGATKDVLGLVNSFLGGGGGSALGAAAAGSSRDWKHDLGPADDPLEGVKQLPLRKWRYRDDAPEPWRGDQAEHSGPSAEQFAQLFGVGDGKTINYIDAIGVLLGAVQRLTERVEELEAQDG